MTSAARPAARPDACPGVLRLHEAADGHLARVRLPGGRIGAPGLRAVAAAAALGNEIVELTSRAGVQVRGLAPDRAAAVAGLLAAGGLLPSALHDRVRNIAAPPLAGRAPAAIAEIDAIVDALDRGVCADPDLVALPGRFLFAVDDGTRALDPLVADVELAAEGEGFRLRLAGRPTTLAVAPRDAAATAIGAARCFIDLADGEAPRAWRVRDLRGGPLRLARALGVGLVEDARAAGLPPAPGRPPARPPTHGVTRQRDGRAAVAAMAPLARLDPTQLRGLAELVGAGATLRLSPWRTLTLVDVEPGRVPEVEAAVRDLGLIVSGASGWVGLSACAGLGACLRARADVRAAATLRARRRRAGSALEHWSACERRCGEPPDAATTVAATPDGLLVRSEAGERRRVETIADAVGLLR